MYISKFFEFSNFFKSFHTNAAGNDPQWQIWPKKWLRLSQNSYFYIFFYLFPQNEAEIDSEWSISPDSQLFPIFCHQSISFLKKSQKFSYLGRGTSANFLSFPTFSNRFTPMQLEMTHNGKFGLNSCLHWVKTAIFAYFSIFSPQNEAEIDSEWSISPDSQLSPSFATKASHFWRNLKNCHIWGGVHRQIF